MLTNLILLLITLLILYFVGMLWLRQSLLNALHDLQRRQEVLFKDYERRRDQVPLLLESIRELQEPTDAWRKLVSDRMAFRSAASRVEEEAFEKELLSFLDQTSLRSVNFLEAKKGIQEISTLIDQQKLELQKAAEAFNAKRREFPYSLAAALFRFQTL
jgi:hypothetical protein